MRRFPLQSLTVWLCLLAFAASILLQSGMVRCSDGHGGSHVEFRCTRNDRNECVKSCGTSGCAESDRLPHPCEDKPLIPDQPRLRMARPQVDLPAMPAPLLVAVIDPFPADPPATSRLRPPRPIERPPDTLGRLRSVILIV